MSEQRKYEFSMTFEVEDDEDVEVAASLIGTPTLLVTAPRLGWEEKPFIAMGEDHD